MEGSIFRYDSLNGKKTLSTIGIVLDQLRSCILLLDRERVILFRNLAAQKVLVRRDGLRERQGRLHARCQASDQRLEAAFVNLLQAQTSSRCEGVLIERLGAQPYRLLLTQLSGRQRLFAPIVDVMVIAEDPESDLLGEERLLKTLYGLSPAEARLALALAQGVRLQDYALSQRISGNTARCHIKRAFAKTQTASQSQLAQLLLRGPLYQVNGTATVSLADGAGSR